MVPPAASSSTGTPAVSRIASAMAFREATVIMIAAAGMAGDHGCWARNPRSLESIPPQVGAGGCTPMPRNDSDCTASRALAAALAVVTAIVGSTLFQMCVRMIQPRDAPSSSATSTYWAAVSPRVTARVIRKKSGEKSTPMASIAWWEPLPMIPVTAMAKMM